MTVLSGDPRREVHHFDLTVGDTQVEIATHTVRDHPKSVRVAVSVFAVEIHVRPAPIQARLDANDDVTVTAPIDQLLPTHRPHDHVRHILSHALAEIDVALPLPVEVTAMTITSRRAEGVDTTFPPT